MKIIQKHQIVISEPICWLSNLCKVKEEHLESIPVQFIAFLDHTVPQKVTFYAYWLSQYAK